MRIVTQVNDTERRVLSIYDLPYALHLDKSDYVMECT